MLDFKNLLVTCHTDFVGKNSTFVAIKGFKTDGFDFIEDAIKKGAKEIVFDQSRDISKISSKYPSIKFLPVENTRKSLALIASERLGNPHKKLKLIGVTGTKGKTTTTFLIEHLLQKIGFKTALLGSIKNKILHSEVQSPLTTLNADMLHAFFHECVTNNVDYVVMEVSSHALSLDRIYGVEFDIACFTNLAPEHMDFYKDLNDYFEAKSILFNQIKQNGHAIINTDDTFGEKLAIMLNTKKNKFSVNTYGQKKQNFSNFHQFTILQNSLAGLKVSIDHKELLSPQLFGEFNAYNMLMATLVGFTINKNLQLNIFEDFKGVPGRLQKHILKNGAFAFVDYAHNPSSFEAVLKALRPLSKHLIVLFGCGGDRDRTKRPMMGQITAKYADEVIITNDNPRTEDPQNIISEILPGIEGLIKLTIEPDRKKAIEITASKSNKNTVIALLGKGHENYQILGTKKIHFDDFEEISKF
ncbi:TPA: UDP-N-acetylmuramoyl-L-alanyl-D-glutamate--2,6-diaminopimelate ligase [Candidatus Dependentiae bacterium]|nr:MAG: UDP-N-acetylmuramoyl-L-alanyl-D-glutamate-2,6-diaminopimelate ligase [candidate division TM6 bacterium GW2011_GWE2_31_21]KKP53228.1 MAG: UDP-N-acetylmuramoyl-L-alanyl-D-glutamate-2,6-diaminopimelate ligase [candidate division TM6 bacterium GW2011_GWF2_33_332]HBS48073.1 UDP-N-acetylmuramoyl-L-alanyl-D-glutamate--2,6-diaminopimelate ligase [Candidatus Dependentiae bacterium]HBZ73324.1 UDP-N-acetylmuramoyl-L-alanyl-D-glutamate--2,6-diaminopimelate ligase [Candidatus Dependentiae bacterium]